MKAIKLILLALMVCSCSSVQNVIIPTPPEPYNYIEINNMKDYATHDKLTMQKLVEFYLWVNVLEGYEVYKVITNKDGSKKWTRELKK